MEWVETTGKTIEEAKDAALDQLGVDERDAEFEIVEEPRAGLFRRLRGEARVRARVRPTRPRPKVDRRDRRRRRAEPRRPSRTSDGGVARASEQDEERLEPRRASSEAGRQAGGGGGQRASGGRRSRSRGRSSSTATTATTSGQAGKSVTVKKGDGMTLEEQAEVVRDFLEGLVDAFGARATVSAVRIDEETMELQVRDGSDLGLFIGPGGQTLEAVQELARTVVQRRGVGAKGRVRVDVEAYRQRRREALERFARKVGEDVRSSGVPRALEPMGSADRKVVHDTINELDGVGTISEGEEPRRRVVVVPAAGATEADETASDADDVVAGPASQGADAERHVAGGDEPPASASA